MNEPSPGSRIVASLSGGSWIIVCFYSTAECRTCVAHATFIQRNCQRMYISSIFHRRYTFIIRQHSSRIPGRSPGLCLGQRRPIFMPIIGVSSADLTAPTALPTKAAYDFFTLHDHSLPQEHLTEQDLYAQTSTSYRPGLVIYTITPAPLIMVFAHTRPRLMSTSPSLEAYAEPRDLIEVVLLEGDILRFDRRTLEGLKERALGVFGGCA